MEVVVWVVFLAFYDFNQCVDAFLFLKSSGEKNVCFVGFQMWVRLLNDGSHTIIYNRWADMINVLIVLSDGF